VRHIATRSRAGRTPSPPRPESRRTAARRSGSTRRTGREYYLARVNWESPRDLLVQPPARDQKLPPTLPCQTPGPARPRYCSRRSPRAGSTCTMICPDRRHRPVHLDNANGWVQTHRASRQRRRPCSALTSGSWAIDSVAAVDTKRREVWFTSGKDNDLVRALSRLARWWRDRAGSPALERTRGRRGQR